METTRHKREPISPKPSLLLRRSQTPSCVLAPRCVSPRAAPLSLRSLSHSLSHACALSRHAHAADCVCGVVASGVPDFDGGRPVKAPHTCHAKTTTRVSSPPRLSGCRRAAADQVIRRQLRPRRVRLSSSCGWQRGSRTCPCQSAVWLHTHKRWWVRSAHGSLLAHVHGAQLRKPLGPPGGAQ